MDNLSLYIQSLIFASQEPISIREISEAISRYTQSEVEEEDIEAILLDIETQIREDANQFLELVELNGGYIFMTKPSFSALIQAHLKNTHNKKLTKAAMETLAVIAYKQPVSKPEVEKIRGVSCDYTIQKLLEKDYVAILGRADVAGKPILYGTSQKFMDHFGLKSIKDLPKLRDLSREVDQIGEVASLEINDSTSNNGHAATYSESDSEE